MHHNKIAALTALAAGALGVTYFAEIYLPPPNFLPVNKDTSFVDVEPSDDNACVNKFWLTGNHSTPIFVPVELKGEGDKTIYAVMKLPRGARPGEFCAPDKMHDAFVGNVKTHNEAFFIRSDKVESVALTEIFRIQQAKEAIQAGREPDGICISVDEPEFFAHPENSFGRIVRINNTQEVGSSLEILDALEERWKDTMKAAERGNFFVPEKMEFRRTEGPVASIEMGEGVAGLISARQRVRS